MKKRYIVLIVFLILIAVTAGNFIYERLHASLYHNINGISFSIIGQSDGPTAVFVAGKLPDGSTENTEIIEELEESKDMKLIIDQTEVSVQWEDNAAVADLIDAVSDNQITIDMSMYGGFEQVGSIGRSLTRDDKQITTNPGDIVLYNGNQLVIFYGSNSWSYTKLGKVQDISNDELTELLSNGDVTINIVR